MHIGGARGGGGGGGGGGERNAGGRDTQRCGGGRDARKWGNDCPKRWEEGHTRTTHTLTCVHNIIDKTNKNTNKTRIKTKMHTQGRLRTTDSKKWGGGTHTCTTYDVHNVK